MPRKAIGYNRTHFYKIVCKDLQVADCYVGHTTNFSTRKSAHKHNSTNEASKDHQMRLYQFIKERGGWDNFDMVLIETRACDSKLEACKFEREYVEQLHATLNCRIPSRTNEEKKDYDRAYALDNCKDYYNANRDAILSKKKEYYINHKEKLVLRAREYRKEQKAKLNGID